MTYGTKKCHLSKRHVLLNNLRYPTVSLSQSKLFKSEKTFAQEKTTFRYKIVGCKISKKKLAPNIEKTLCLSFDINFGNISFITLSKSREIIQRFSVHFLDLQDFLKNRGLMLQTSDFYFCDLIDELSHIAQNIFSEKKIKFSKVI